MSANEQMRNDELGELLVKMEENGEHGLTVSDIIISFINNVMLEEQRDEILARIS